MERYVETVEGTEEADDAVRIHAGILRRKRMADAWGVGKRPVGTAPNGNPVFYIIVTPRPPESRM